MTRSAALAFWLALAVFIAAAVWLSIVNQSPGSADSCGNLVGARNIVKGRGFVSIAAGSLWVFTPLPSLETTRPPALPYLIAAIFAVTGVSLAVPVALNAVAVVLNACLLRKNVTQTCGPDLGYLAGILILFSSNYEMLSIWNNNILAACTSALLLVGSRRQGTRWADVVLLAAISALGFLMKPTFMLSALPYSCLVLGGIEGQTRTKRTLEIFVYLSLFAALTSVYWGPNLWIHGQPLYSPSFTSGRLAERYGVLGADSWHTLRFGQPMTYAEVVQKLGLAGLLIADARMMAKTVFYMVCLNPLVFASATGLLLFGKKDHWREILGPCLILSGIFFEVGIYNHHEFRYLWPMYPCLLTLTGLTVRGFRDWGVSQMSPALVGRFHAFFRFLLCGSLLIGFAGCLETWRQAFQTARRPPPEWVETLRKLPESAVILTADVPAVAWWADRKAVIDPVGDRRDLATVVNRYRADHYLSLTSDPSREHRIAFQAEDLSELARGDGWTLYRIPGPILLDSRPKKVKKQLQSGA